MGKKSKLKSSAPLPSALTVAATKRDQPKTGISQSEPGAGVVEARIAKLENKNGRSSLGATAAPATLPKPVAEVPLRVEKPLAQGSAKVIDVQFDILEPEARQVSLCGAFNGWSPEATPMIRQGNGHWKATVALPPGRHEYKLVVNGEWRPDMNSSEHVSNEFGTLNSVVVVGR